MSIATWCWRSPVSDIDKVVGYLAGGMQTWRSAPSTRGLG